MERLAQIIEALAVRRGYAFYSGEDHTAGAVVRVYPAVWLSPPTVEGRSGRSEGTTTYGVTLHLMTLEPDSFASLQFHALALASEAAQSEQVLAIEDVKAQSAIQSLTAHGESSVTLTFRATLWFYN